MTIIASAVAVTLPGARPETTAVAATPMVYVAPRHIPHVPRPRQLGSQWGQPGSIERIVRDVPTVVSPAFPSTDLLETIAERIPWPDYLRDRVGRAEHSGDSVFGAASVDRVVAPASGNGQPEYPAMLRQAAAEGEVHVRFVVDTVGRVEPTSIEIVRATHPLFGAAVQRWLSRNRYLPAEVSGRPVRQVVEQRIEFTLRQRD